MDKEYVAFTIGPEFSRKNTQRTIKSAENRGFNIGKFQNIATFSSENWSERLLEEEEKLKQLRTYYWENSTNLSLIRTQFDILNPRQLYCTIKITSSKEKSPIFINFIIRLPLRYPFIPPKATDFSLYDFIKNHHDFKRWDNEDPDFKDFRFACLGELESRWEKDGSMGIAHYIQMLFYYTAFDHFAINV